MKIKEQQQSIKELSTSITKKTHNTAQRPQHTLTSKMAETPTWMIKILSILTPFIEMH